MENDLVNLIEVSLYCFTYFIDLVAASSLYIVQVCNRIIRDFTVRHITYVRTTGKQI